MTEPQFFNPYADVRITSGKNLPHWQQIGATYFVTYRLADSIPEDLRRTWKLERETWVQAHPHPWTSDIESDYHQKFSATIDRWLDHGHGSCLLRQRQCAEITMSSIRHFEAERLSVISAVVMPNHVHALFVLHPAHTLEQLVKSWKRFSATRINIAVSRSGNLWQPDYFDRLVRDWNHFANCVRYIRRNPLKARLRKDDYLLYESDVARTIK